MALEGTAPPYRSPVGRAYHYLMTGCGLVAALLFGAMGVLVCADVILRNIGGGSIAWSVEGTEYMLMLATFVAAPWLLYLGDHIRIDIVLRAAPPPLRRALDALTDILGLVVCATLAVHTLAVTRDAAVQGGLVFKVLMFPQWWLNLPMLFGATLLTIEFARRLLRPLFVRAD